MSGILITNALVWTEGRIQAGAVLVRGGQVESVHPGSRSLARIAKGVSVTDAQGGWVLPGMIDIHFHGMQGYDAENLTPDSLSRLERRLLLQGVTGALLSFYSLSLSTLRKNLAVLRDYLQKKKGLSVFLGINLEGPFLNKKQSGAHDVRKLKSFSDKPALRLVQDFRDIIRVITVAPELPGAGAAVRLFRKWGIRVMAGHTLATFQEMQRAEKWGVRGITHLFNRTSSLHHREVGVPGFAFLNRNIYVEIIADGIHVCPQAFLLSLRNIPRDRMIFVSDMVPPLKNSRRNIYLKEDGVLAGGSRTLAQGVRFAMKTSGEELPDIWRCVSLNPAAFLGISAFRGRIGKGMKADILVMDRNLSIRRVMKSGEWICAE